MSGPDMLERVRMCLAEVGEDPGLASQTDEGALLILGDPRVAWRAWSIAAVPLANPNKYLCWTCCTTKPATSKAEAGAIRAACEATRPCVEDCGRDRSP